MLYIFHVDTGTTITFDIKLALQSVAELKESIERECGVVSKDQVLLMSGGESLESNARVCSYSAGTDTNPIYLFSKAAIESNYPPTPSIDYGCDVDLQSQVDASLLMPATYQTIVTRAQLAQQCCGLARDQTRICEKLVHDQHLQQQGWAAVVANLEDVTQMFQSRAEQFQHSFTVYQAERQQYIELLQNFSDDVGTLSKIPILPALRAQAEGLLSPDELPTTEEDPEVLSLLKWISAKDNQSTLEQVAEQCSRGLEQFNERVMESLMDEANAAILNANKQDMKEVKGLGERLMALEDLMAQTKKIVQEQSELAHGFLQNQNRTKIEGDASVLPDLCTSHKRQLTVMLNNHNQLRDIRRRCAKAKEELSANIYYRLKWVVYVESKIIDIDCKLIMYHESLKRLKRHLEVLQQIHLAPEMYMSAITEVVRRRTFSQSFLTWASTLACQLLTVHSEELNRRREFQTKFEGHFLNTLFPGLEDTPPPFATQAPPVFDNSLPKLTVDDMESLRKQLPDLALSVSSPDLNSITQFFYSKSLSEGSVEGNKDKESTSMPVDVSSKDQEPSVVRPQMLVDRGDFESETDTEEFEKIGQGATDSKLNYFEGMKHTQQKEMEENLGNSQDEVERLRALLRVMKTVSCDAIQAFRTELVELKGRMNLDENGIATMTEQLNQAVTLHSNECKRLVQEREQELTVHHELEMADMKKMLQSRDEDIRVLKDSILDKEMQITEHERLLSTIRQTLENEKAEINLLQARFHGQLKEAVEQANTEKEKALKEANEARIVEISSLTNSLTQCQERIQELEKELSAAHDDQQRLIKEASDKMQMDYKTELENIRSRFKLMAASTMERSPSDCSLEKIERTDMIELVNHEAILAQVKEDMKVEKAAEIRLTIEKERADFAVKLDQELQLARQMVDDKEREMKMYRARELSLIEEVERYKNTIGHLTESESMIRQTLNKKVENLESFKLQLESKMAAERKILEQRENQVYDLEVERNELRQELQGERTKKQSGIGHEENLENDQDDDQVSESKKVKLEADNNPAYFSRRVEMLEDDNKRLNAELLTVREETEMIEALVQSLEADKVRLEIELVKERSKRSFAGDSVGSSSSGSTEGRDKDMNTSVAVVAEPTSRDVATSPEPHRREAMSVSTSTSTPTQIRDKLTKSTVGLVQQGRISISSCNPGDSVLILWDPQHRNYIIFQEAATFYFLNSDCIDMLDLRVGSDGIPKRMHIVAEVVDKEYCHARKPENRFRVPQGTKFYRVRVKPVQRVEPGQPAKSQ